MPATYVPISKCAQFMVSSDVPVKELMEELQAEIIRLALRNNLYNRTYTAEALGMERATLNAQIKRFYYAGLLSEEDMTGNKGELTWHR